MLWPTMSDYQDAIQNPQVAFMDEELRQGRPVLDALGLPKPITGGFASVYQVNSERARWAVRCFLRGHPDTEKRYHCISKHLQEAGLPYIAEFQYLPRGILVRGQWYPILKMGWVEGEPLNLYVEKNLTHASLLRDLDREFAKMVRDLRRFFIAHGDLQHGNVLVVNGKLKLVDYDGMFVPDLDGLPSHELGHPNYQHPARSASDFGLHLDNFSAHMIRASLIGLSLKPSLWDISGAGDEQLVFSRKDYNAPGSSRVLKAMEDSRDATLLTLASRARSIMMCPSVSVVPAPAVEEPPRRPGWIIKSFRLGDADQSRFHRQAAAGLAHGEGAISSWPEDRSFEKVPKFEGSFAVDRAVIAGYGLYAVAWVRAAWLEWIAGAWAARACAVGFVVVASVILTRFVRTREFRARWSAWIGRMKILREIRLTRKALDALTRRAKRVDAKERRAVQAATAQLGKLKKHYHMQQAKVDTWLQRSLGKISETYGEKWLPLLVQEERARVEATRRKARIKGEFEVVKDRILLRLKNVQKSVSDERVLIEAEVAEEEEHLTSQESRAAVFGREIALYRGATLTNYLMQIVGLFPGGHRQGVDAARRGGP